MVQRDERLDKTIWPFDLTVGPQQERYLTVHLKGMKESIYHSLTLTLSSSSSA